ncbi:MAG: hypothetical protein KatS3mg068_1509 [Candidatus Sericytochromatia bacterium]|nr:MAG: hypothetical protein KatS3mg068_1509 [Candidatus Sericytochromatia bacterium]
MENNLYDWYLEQIKDIMYNIRAIDLENVLNKKFIRNLYEKHKVIEERENPYIKGKVDYYEYADEMFFIEPLEEVFRISKKYKLEVLSFLKDSIENGKSYFIYCGVSDLNDIIDLINNLSVVLYVITKNVSIIDSLDYSNNIRNYCITTYNILEKYLQNKYITIEYFKESCLLKGITCIVITDREGHKELRKENVDSELSKIFSD